MRFSHALLAAALLLPQAAVHGQDRNESGRLVYKVEFLITDGSGAGKAPRRYTLLTDTGRKAIFKVGSRVPVSSGSFQANGAGNAPLVNTQFTYLDVGASIDCILEEANGKLQMHGNLDLSGVLRDAAPSHAGQTNPTLTQTRVDLSTVLEPGKRTLIASIDDPESSRQFQLEATVTRVN